MSVSPEERKRYFQETAIALRREGFRIEPSVGGRLGVWLDDHPICEVDQIGGITYRSDNVPTPEYVAAKDKAYKIVSTTAEYMRQMEQAPSMKASGLEDSYRVLADFNGTVLAGTHSKYGVQFVTWDWDYDRKGLSHGHYFSGNYGVVTIPFPIPREQFNHCIELVEALEVGNASTKDCNVDEIRSAWPVLKRLEGKVVNLDELDYLAKRLDSFDVGEAAQFQAMAHKLELFELKDLINLTFCCQQATVITDFSDLEAIGRDHYMNLHGGCASTQELEDLDGAETARLLIDSGAGEVTPYGVVYDNGMKLEQLYDGKHLPCYHYDADLLTVALTSRLEPEDTPNITWL